MKADVSIDCVGLYCPMPIVNTAKSIQKMDPGQVLELIADDEGVKQDLPNWSRITGNEFLGIEEVNGKYHVYIKKKA